MTSFDDFLKTIGEFGPYQKRVYAFLCFPSLTLSALLVAHVFILGVPEHRCKIPGLDNDTFAVQDDTHAGLINATIPYDDKGKYEKCDYFIQANTTSQCSEWVYDETVYKYTFARKLDMVCDNSIKIPNAQMIFYFGVLVGSFTYGQLSDIIGRRKALYLAILVLLGSSCGLVGMTEYIGFCVLMFLVGGACLGLYLVSYVISMEMVGPSKRLWTGNIIQAFLTTGTMILCLLVYLIRDWRWYTLAIGLQCVFFLPYYWLVPDTPRWLLSKDKREEALVILKKTAKANKKEFNTKLLDSLDKAPPQGKIWQLFSNRRLGIRTAVIFFNWFVCAMSYYGTVMNVDNLSGSVYLNFALLTAVEYPAKALAMLLLDRIGRKKLHMGFLFVGGLACIGTMWPILDGSENLQPVLIALALIGKMCMVGAFGTIYVLSTESFPTVVRNAGMGASSALARIGSMIAPYIAKSATLVGGSTGQAIPLTLFGIAMFVAGLSTIILPETLNRQLPESIEDAVNAQKIKTRNDKEIWTLSNGENGGYVTDDTSEKL